MIKLADRYWKVFNEIKEKSPNGGVQAKDLVDHSRPKKAPLHDQFEWDDAKAGEEWRIQQARVMMSVYTIENNPNVRAVQHVIYELETGKSDRAYFTYETIQKRPELKEAFLKQFKKHVENMKKKYKDALKVYHVVNDSELERLDKDLETKKRGYATIA